MTEYIPIIIAPACIILACACAYRLGWSDGLTAGIDQTQRKATRREVAATRTRFYNKRSWRRL
jgi:hypothetical protein